MPINDKNITPAIPGIVSGQRAIKVGDKVYPVGIGGNFLPNVNQIDVDLSFVTAAEGDILTGKVGADENGNPVNGTLTLPPDAEAVSVSGNVVTIPPGNRAEKQEITVGKAKAAENITPGTANQTIAADTYLTGDLTIKGDANLIASNIKSGVTIFDVTGTFEGSGGGGTGSGTFDLAKVTEFSPYAPTMTGLSEIVVSGLGDDYDSANGRYKVTAETEKETDPFKRIYKHTSGEWYFWGEYNSEYEEGYWYIGPAADSGLFVCYVAEELTDNTYTFENWDTGDSYDVTLDVTKTTYPETPMTLKGVMATGYADGEWTFDANEASFTGFENEPKVGNVYAVIGDKLIGNYVSVVSSYAADGNTVLMLNFNGNDALADSSTYAHVVTQEKGAILPGGYAGNAWNFNGGFLKIEPKGDEFVFGTNDFTIEAYVCPTSDSRQCFFSYWSDAKFAICFSYNGDRRIGVFGAAHGWSNRNVSDPLELNKWYHLAFVRRGNTLYCYIDGKVTGTADMTNVNVGQQMAISFGRWGNDPGDFSARWQGYMDDIRISNVARY